MQGQARQLADLVENVLYLFGSQGADENCCENISRGEYRALRAVTNHDVCTMQDIAKSAAVTKSGATRIVKRLEDKGLAKRHQDKKDGRICCVAVTEDGKKLLARIEDQLMNRMMTVLAVMEPDMRDILLISIRAFCHAAEGQRIGWSKAEDTKGASRGQ